MRKLEKEEDGARDWLSVEIQGKWRRRQRAPDKSRWQSERRDMRQCGAQVDDVDGAFGLRAGVNGWVGISSGLIWALGNSVAAPLENFRPDFLLVPVPEGEEKKIFGDGARLACGAEARMQRDWRQEAPEADSARYTQRFGSATRSPYPAQNFLQKYVPAAVRGLSFFLACSTLTADSGFAFSCSRKEERLARHYCIWPPSPPQGSRERSTSPASVDAGVVSFSFPDASRRSPSNSSRSSFSDGRGSYSDASSGRSRGRRRHHRKSPKKSDKRRTHKSRSSKKRRRDSDSDDDTSEDDRRRSRGKKKSRSSKKDSPAESCPSTTKGKPLAEVEDGVVELDPAQLEDMWVERKGKF
ncbi:MAG: hypothetical protein BJ554DRAFT_5620 [Olpidium bornovanus]|uniref:Uncharacterized protein n=1 Tax=Olpidium bornovanus TaxID=278681 RepID=A0A8H8DMA2_9FUNG|nr:MAG: hypothetical protein BJ554DRAFT_5620 [Olpidium bornovanus]